MYKVRLCDWSGSFLGDVVCSLPPDATVAQLKQVLFGQIQALCGQSPGGYTLQDGDGSLFADADLVSAHLSRGDEVHSLALVLAQQRQQQVQQQQQQQFHGVGSPSWFRNNNNNNNNANRGRAGDAAGRGGQSRELAEDAAKVVKALGKLKQDRLVACLMQQCYEETLDNLINIEVPTAEASVGGSGSRQSKAEKFAAFYASIKSDVAQTLKKLEEDAGYMNACIVVEPMNFSEFCELEVDAVSSDLQRMKLFVENAQKAVSDSTRLTIANYIALSKRLREARDLFGTLRGTQQAADLELRNLEDFYRYLNHTYSVDYCRKLISFGIFADCAPNVALVSCCGIGKFLRYLPELLDLARHSPAEMLWWRTVNGAFDWNRQISLSAFEGPQKRQRMASLRQESAQETANEWRDKSVAVFAQVQAEIAAENAVRTAEAQKKSKLVEDAILLIEAESRL